MPSPFDKLPQELYDEIFEYITWPDWEGPESRSTQPTRDQVHTFDWLINIHRRPVENGIRLSHPQWNEDYTSSRQIPGDLQLRLVSRAFNLAVMRVFFKYDGVKFVGYKENTLQNLEEHILHDGNRAWDIGSAVQKLEMVLGTGRYATGSVFYKEHPESTYAPEQEEREALTKGAIDLKTLLDSRTVTRLVQRMPRLTSLIIHLPEEWRSLTPWSDYPYNESDDIGQYGLQYNLPLLHSLRSDLATIFSSATPHTTPAPDPRFPPNPLLHLTYLRLSLPCAYDIAHIASHVPSPVAQRLRHLYLEIIDGTGPGGDLAYTKAWDGEDSEDEGDSEFLPSNLQFEHPNTENFGPWCDLIARCTHLESLGLVGTQCIDLDTLTWRPASTSTTTGGGGLRNIFLSRVTCSASTLLSLLSPPPGEINSPSPAPPPIQALDITDIRLSSGTWHSIFTHLLSALELLHFYVYNLTYDVWGESKHLGERNNRPWENVDVIWTQDEGEREMVAEVVRGVKGRGWAVEEKMEWHAYEYGGEARGEGEEGDGEEGEGEGRVEGAVF